MKKTIFKVLAKINKVILPRYSKKDVTRLSKFQQAIVGYRYWILINSMD